MKAYVEAPAGWGPVRVILVRLERLGYAVDELRLATGEVRLVLRGTGR